VSVLACVLVTSRALYPFGTDLIQLHDSAYLFSSRASQDARLDDSAPDFSTALEEHNNELFK
jgi:hypothetical protein